MAETLILKGTMHGHFEDVTAIATPSDNSDIIVSSSNNSILLWTLPKESANSSETAGSTPYSVPRLRLTGHSECVQDVVLSSDGQLALSGSGEGELRLWDVNTGATIRSFVGLTGDVLSVALSADNRQIVSASMDHTIMLWDILGGCKYTIQDADGSGECKYTIQDADGHSDWVSCVRFSPNNLLPTIVSGSWDRTVKVWNPTNYKLKSTLVGHEGFVYTVAVSPDGSVCASGDSDGLILLWDLAVGESLYSLDDNEIINSLCFCPNKHWICAATEGSVKIWDIENEFSVQDLKTDAPTGNNERFYCTRLSWSCDGSTLFTGYTDGTIRVWGFSRSD